MSEYRRLHQTIDHMAPDPLFKHIGDEV